MTDSAFGLDSKTIEKINSVFSKKSRIESARLYGSRAKGNYRPNSDIDLTLIGKNLDTTLLFKVENELDDLLLPYSIDLSILDQIENKELVEHIKRSGIEFYSKKSRTAPCQG